MGEIITKIKINNVCSLAAIFTRAQENCEGGKREKKKVSTLTLSSCVTTSKVSVEGAKRF